MDAKTSYKTLQEAPHKVGLGETRRRLIRKRCRYFSLDKCKEAFDTALDLMQTKPSDAAFLAVFFEHADRKQLVMSFLADL